METAELALPASQVSLESDQRMIKADEGNYVVLRSVDSSELEVVHTFADGVYSRSVIMPKGFVLIGFHHPHETLNVVLTGSMVCVIDGELRDIVAPCVFTNKPGTKIGFAKEDCHWITVHPNPDNETDLYELDSHIHDRSKSYTHDIQNQADAFLLSLAKEITK